MSQSSMRTPLGKVRGLGSAKEGANHFIRQRVTAIANVVLVPLVLFLLIKATRGGYESAAQFVSNPIFAVILILAAGAAFYHMRLGMQVIIEDYVHDETAKLVLLMANTFFAVAVGLASAFAILMLSFKV